MAANFFVTKECDASVTSIEVDGLRALGSARDTLAASGVRPTTATSATQTFDSVITQVAKRV